MLVIKQLTVAMDFHNFVTTGQWLLSNVWLPTFFKMFILWFI